MGIGIGSMGIGEIALIAVVAVVLFGGCLLYTSDAADE